MRYLEGEVKIKVRKIVGDTFWRTVSLFIDQWCEAAVLRECCDTAPAMLLTPLLPPWLPARLFFILHPSFIPQLFPECLLCTSRCWDGRVLPLRIWWFYCILPGEGVEQRAEGTEVARGKGETLCCRSAERLQRWLRGFQRGTVEFATWRRRPQVSRGSGPAWY